MDRKMSLLVFAVSMILVGSGVGAGSMALMAIDPDPYNIPVGHVAFGFQRDDGKFVVGSFGPDEGNPLFGSLETQVFDDLKSVKKYFSASGYKTLKGIYVDNIDPTAAENTMTALKDSGFVSIQSAYPTEVSSIIMPGTENCLTFAVKVLEAYGADMPAIIPLVTSWPNAYYDALSKLGWIESPVSSQPPSVRKASIISSQSLGAPLLSPPTSDISGFSDPNKKGYDVPETSGDDLYINKKTDVWYIDAFSWSGDRNLLPRPAAPLKFVSGEYNSYGYNWIYLPYDQTGMTYSQGYLTWVEEYLASIGSPGPSAGVGLLVDEGNGGGGW